MNYRKLSLIDPEIKFENDYFVAAMPAGFDTNVILNFIHLEFEAGLIHKNSVLVFSTGAFLFIPKDVVAIRELLYKYFHNSKRKKTALVVDSTNTHGFVTALVNKLQDLPFEQRVFSSLAKAKRWIEE